MFEVAFEVGWFDCDANRHLKNTAFLEYAIEARFRYFHENGFPASAFAKHQIGPVVVKDEITYKRELHLLDRFKVQFLSAGINESGTRNLVVNRIIRPDGELAAEVRSMIVCVRSCRAQSACSPAGACHGNRGAGADGGLCGAVTPMSSRY